MPLTCQIARPEARLCAATLACTRYKSPTPLLVSPIRSRFLSHGEVATHIGRLRSRTRTCFTTGSGFQLVLLGMQRAGTLLFQFPHDEYCELAFLAQDVLIHCGDFSNEGTEEDFGHEICHAPARWDGCQGGVVEGGK